MRQENPLHHQHRTTDREKRLQFLRASTLRYDDDLPIVQRRDEIAELIRQNQVIVLCGETGSGKSTQIPKICLELGRGITGTIGHTQPRQIAARTIAARIAEELGTPLGQTVGYKVRFDEKLNPNTLVKLMTDGILLAESQSDKSFRQYDTLIIDEAHERTLNIDFLLGMLRRVLPQRPDLKLIITSATIDAKRFADHFTVPTINRGKPVPMVEVTGRTFPIEIIYRSLDEFDDEDEVSRETDLEERAILAAVNELAQQGPGDILVFLPTERDILEIAKSLQNHPIPGDDRARRTEILPLYARLPVNQQQKVFEVGGGGGRKGERGKGEEGFRASVHRRIVLATNVAESSLTVPGIRYVIDTGTARISRYSARSRTQRLPIEAVSQASADQRTGRCGRIGPGVCIRLFSELDYKGRERYTTPEIQRTNLASVILQTMSLRLGDIRKFPFIDPPRPAAINDGYNTLFEIGAIDQKDRQDRLTELGWKLSRLPVDPRIGRMILAADENDVLHEMLIVAAVLEIQDPRERPRDHQEKADAAHAAFLDDRSDYLGHLKLWDFYQNLKEKTSRSGLRKACLQHFLSYNRMKEWNDIYVQLRQFVHEASMNIGDRKTNFDTLYEPLHRSILAGNLSGIAQRDNRWDYSICGGGKFVLWPGSGLAKRIQPQPDKNKHNNKKGVVPASTETDGDLSDKLPGLPHWILAGERVETTRRYLRTVAEIDSKWIEPLAGHLIQRTYLEPHWNPDTGYVHAYERVTLLGITIVPKRRINFGPIDPRASRDIFIQCALVEEQLETDLEFFEYNRLICEEAEKLQDKLRRPELMKPQTARYEFYQARIPEEVYDKRSLEKWVRTSGTSDALAMKLRDLCTEDIADEVLASFPDTLNTFDGSAAKLEYRFAPGEEDDGLTVMVPQETLRQLDSARLGWLVPGLVERKIVALLKSLPKELRRQIVPVPDTARDLVGKINFGHGDLEGQLAVQVSRLVGRLVVPADFNRQQLPRELCMNIKVLDPSGETVGAGRDLDELRKSFGVAATASISTADPRWNRTGLTKWDFGDLPESIELDRGGLCIKAFPMICGDSLALADSLDRAVCETRLGLVRLAYLVLKREIRSQIQWLPQVDRLRVYAQPLPEFDFQEDVGLWIASRSIRVDELPLPRSQFFFEERCRLGREHLVAAIQEVTKLIGPLLESFHEARLAIEQGRSKQTEFACRDARESLLRLVAPGFLVRTDWRTLREFPRYFRAVPLRFEKLRNGGEAADRAGTEELGRYWDKYIQRLELHQAAGITDSELDIFRWMLEEYRVSLFAQRLGTTVKVSPTRLDKQYAKSTYVDHR